MADALPPLGGLSLNDDPPPDPPPTTVQDLPLEITDVVLASYLAKLEVGELCEANLLQICMALRGTNQCNDPDDPLWKAACARFGLTERLVGGTPDAPATPTWHVTFLAMCKEVATLQPDRLATYKGLLRGDDAYVEGFFSYDSEDDDPDEEATTERRLRWEVRHLWTMSGMFGQLCMVHSLLRLVDGIVNAGGALTKAVEYGYLAIVEVLLAHGGDVHTRYRDRIDGAAVGDDSLLTLAIKRGDLAIVEVLLAHGASVDEDDYYSHKPLRIASRRGRLAIVEVLLAHGADVNAADQFGETALIEASENGHVAVVEVLLAHGANVHARDGAALRNASGEGHVAVVEVLLAHGADVNGYGYHGYGMALATASAKGHLAVVEVLLAHGANVDTLGSAHGQPLLRASQNGHLAVVEVLLAHGADVHAEDGHHDNKTAFMHAREKGHLAVVVALRAAGATSPTFPRRWSRDMREIERRRRLLV